MLVSALLTTSLRKIGILASGESATPEELADALSDLQVMLRSWGALSMNIFASTKESITLTPGKFLYTWGTGGDINTARPNQVVGAYILETLGVTHPVDIISEGKYRNLSVKGTVSRPYALFFHPTVSLAEVYLYPVPSDAEALYLDSFKPFSEVGSIDDLASEIAFPTYYEEPIIYGLAGRLAPGYGKTLPPEVMAIAASSYDRMIIRNAAQQVEPVYIIVPASAPYGARYSINSDTYH